MASKIRIASTAANASTFTAAAANASFFFTAAIVATNMITFTQAQYKIM